MSGFNSTDTILGSEVIKPKNKAAPQEGDLFKVIVAYGKTFEIRYGYYEEIDRHSKYNEPDAIYPNFLENPVYTDDGIPFVTAMQRKCEHYKGDNADEDETNCYECQYYEKCDELLGICRCKKNRKPDEST